MWIGSSISFWSDDYFVFRNRLLICKLLIGVDMLGYLIYNKFRKHAARSF